MNHSGKNMIQFFQYGHLPEPMQRVSRPFAQLAKHVVESVPDNFQKMECLDLILKAKDCAVRAHLYKPEFTVNTEG